MGKEDEGAERSPTEEHDMKGAILEWFYRPAQWWQFWLPQSGFIGGLILMGLAVTLIAISK